MTTESKFPLQIKQRIQIVRIRRIARQLERLGGCVESNNLDTTRGQPVEVATVVDWCIISIELVEPACCSEGDDAVGSPMVLYSLVASCR